MTNPYKFYTGDIVKISGRCVMHAGRCGVVLISGTEMCMVEIKDTLALINHQLWYLNDYLERIPEMPDYVKMEDTREYLKQVTGDT